ncbi:MAG: DASS family sodium-coupled anion symporter [Bacteroidota bacterium]
MQFDLKRVGLLLGPSVFLLVLLLPNPAPLSLDAWHVVALAGFMLVWWVTEAVPIPVTAILPLVILPYFGIEGLDLKTVAAPYANPIVFLFMGGFMIALAMERWNLHRRIALNIVKLTGTNANGIVFGFMLATAFLSMWISNTATTVMMLPIALSVIGLLQGAQSSEQDQKGLKNFAISMMLGIAASANVGGTATIIGTPPTVVFAGYIKQTFDYEVGFTEWLKMGLPFASIMLLAIYFVIVRVFYPNRLGKFEGAQAVIDTELSKLGKMTIGERRTLIVFISTAFLWVFRNQLNALFKLLLPSLQLSDTGIAMLATVVLFIFPVNWKKQEFILKWGDTEKLAWGILLLFGGGLSLAGALAHTGIIDMIGDQFKNAAGVGFLIMLGLTAVSLFLTEIMSNLALVAVFLPVVGGIAVGMDLDPLYLCIPVTLAASCAFMLPMSTPPNAIVFASGYIKIHQMARAGILLNIVAIILITLIAVNFIPS